MVITALLTGKGNSSFKDKNILPVLGKPLLYYPANAAKHSKYINGGFYVSSDGDKLLDIAEGMGYKKIKRPDEYAQSDSGHDGVLMHAYNAIKEMDGIVPDIFVVLLANNGFIKSTWIDECIEMMLKDDSLSAVVPAFNEQEHHPYRAKKLDADGNLVPFIDTGNQVISTVRQELTAAYHIAHNFWVMDVKKSMFAETGHMPWTFMGPKVKPYVVDMCFDVHNPKELKDTEEWIKENYTD